MQKEYPYHPENFIPDVYDMKFNSEINFEGSCLEWNESTQAWHEIDMFEYFRYRPTYHQSDWKPVMINVPPIVISIFCHWIEERHIGRGFEGGRSRKLTYKQMMKFVYSFHTILHLLAKYKFNPIVQGSIDTEQLYLDSEQD